MNVRCAQCVELHLEDELGPVELAVFLGRVSALHRLEVDDASLDEVAVVVVVEQQVDRTGDAPLFDRNLEAQLNLRSVAEVGV